MKRRTKAILAAVLSAALLAASALAFTACGEEDGFARVYEMTDWSANYTTATEVTALRGMEVGSGFYDMVIVSEENGAAIRCMGYTRCVQANMCSRSTRVAYP